jgi:HEAT repeat protein
MTSATTHSKTMHCRRAWMATCGAALWILSWSAGCTPRGVAMVPHHGAVESRYQFSAAVVLRATNEVLAAAKNDNPFLRAHAVETAMYLPAQMRALVGTGLKDDAAVVRFAALAVVGRLKLVELAPQARLMLDDADRSVQAAARFALIQCGHGATVPALTDLLTDPHRGTRANVAILVGMSGDDSAIPALKRAARVALDQASAEQATLVRLQIAEAVALLGSDEALGPVEVAAFSPFVQVRILAVSILGKLSVRHMQPALYRMLAAAPLELQIAAAGALARMGRFDGLGQVMAATRSSIPAVRGQAALALGQFTHQARAGGRLGELLADRQTLVRIAAAAAILAHRSQAARSSMIAPTPVKSDRAAIFSDRKQSGRLTKPSRQVMVLIRLRTGMDKGS